MPLRYSKRLAKKPRFLPASLRFPALDGLGDAWISTHEAARITASSTGTVNRWRRTGKIPPACLRLLQLHQAGMVIPDAWRHSPCAFTQGGDLVVAGYVFKRSELEGYGVMLQALRSLQRERDAARGLDVGDGRPALVILPGGRA